MPLLNNLGYRNDDGKGSNDSFKISEIFLRNPGKLNYFPESPQTKLITKNQH